jgi:hypothetical protein
VFFRKILPFSHEKITTDQDMKDPSEMTTKELKEAVQRAGLGQQALGLMEKHEFIKLLQ